MQRGGESDIEKHKRFSCTELYEKRFTGSACNKQPSDDDENEKCSRAEDDLLVDIQRDEETKSDAINDG